MRTLEELRGKIEGAADLHAIVRTMKTLAAVNIRQYEQAVVSAATYYRTVELGLRVVLAGGALEATPRLAGETGSTGAVIFGTDQGLCGGFTEQIVSHALDSLGEKEPDREKRRLLCLGGRTGSLLLERGERLDQGFGVPDSLNGITPLVRKLLVALDSWRHDQGVSRILLCHHQPISSVSYRPHTAELLPLGPERFRAIAGIPWLSRVLPTYSMERERLFSTLVRQHLFVTLYRATAESMASENAARLSSMQAAEKNIEELLEELSARYREQRQSSITAELLDIVAGAEALRSQGAARGLRRLPPLPQPPPPFRCGTLVTWKP